MRNRRSQRPATGSLATGRSFLHSRVFMQNAVLLRVQLGPFELDLKAGELRKGEGKVRLQEQPFQILLMLVQRSGDLVTLDEIKKKLWPNDTVVEFDHSIHTAIKKLRQALDDSADNPKYIETVARRGYRLMVPVECLESTPGDGLSSDAASHSGGDAVGRTPPVPSLIGRKVSHYRVLEIIGGGGMGLVYKAEDLKLGRRVALKFLPEEVATDSLALQRFEREARTASSLNHPNICTIHEIEEHEGQLFIVMELLEGETLRDRLAASEGSLPLAELLSVAIQISDGLQAAHERGIIHRDIKPANIFITDKGVCKILDFGLAKLLETGDQEEPAARPAIWAATLPDASEASCLTRTGTAMGTAGYMSPEQVRGEKLDARTDLFSFGLVLYEMATRRRAFSGETAEVVRDAILQQPQIPVRDLNSKLPLNLEIVINKALEKDRQARYQTAAEMGADLKQKPRRYGRRLVVGAALAIVLLALGLRFRWLKDHPTVPKRTLSEQLLTHIAAENRLTCAAISPDSKYLAYTDLQGLHLSVIETGEIHNMPLPEELRTHLWSVAWFPDGEKLLFTADSKADGYSVWMTSVFGGTPHKLRDDGQWPVVSPQGSLIAFVGGHDHEIWVMGANGENPHRVLGGENEVYAALAWSPTGRRLAYVRAGSPEGGSLETVSLDGGPPSIVISDSQLQNDDGPGLVWLRDGHLIFFSFEGPLHSDAFGGRWHNGENLWTIMTDPLTGKPSGNANKITNWDELFPYSVTASSDGNRLAVVKTHIRDDVYIGESEDGGRRLASPKRLTVSESIDNPTGWMSDGKTILFSSNRTGRTQIFRQRIEQDTAELLISEPDDQGGAELSPDGRWILYWSTARGEDSRPRLMRFPSWGGSPEQVLEARIGDAAAFDCPVRPTSSCVFSHRELGQLIFYAFDPIRGRGKELGRTEFGPSTYVNWRVSPEGSRIAFTSLDHLRGQVHIIDFLNSTERTLSLPDSWSIWYLSWTADGNALFASGFSGEFFMARIEVNGKSHVLLNGGRSRGLFGLYPSADGHYLAFSERIWDSNAWLLENF